jgi:hypothetical protein
MVALAVAWASRRLKHVKFPGVIRRPVALRLASFDARSLACQRQELVTLRHIYDVCSTRPLSIAPWLHRQVSRSVALCASFDQ